MLVKKSVEPIKTYFDTLPADKTGLIEPLLPLLVHLEEKPGASISDPSNTHPDISLTDFLSNLDLHSITEDDGTTYFTHDESRLEMLLDAPIDETSSEKTRRNGVFHGYPSLSIEEKALYNPPDFQTDVIAQRELFPPESLAYLQFIEYLPAPTEKSYQDAINEGLGRYSALREFADKHRLDSLDKHVQNRHSVGVRYYHEQKKSEPKTLTEKATRWWQHKIVPEINT